MGKNKNKLNKAEQKTTAAFKLMADRIKILEKSLRETQDHLESYREKYHEADKDNAVNANKNRTIALHEFLKFLSSGILGAIGVNMVSAKDYNHGAIVLVGAAVLYALIVWFDRKN